MAQQYDSAAKYLMLVHPQSLAKLVFGDQEVEMLGARDTEQRVFAERHNDSTHEVSSLSTEPFSTLRCKPTIAKNRCRSASLPITGTY